MLSEIRYAVGRWEGVRVGSSLGQSIARALAWEGGPVAWMGATGSSTGEMGP